MSDIEQWLESGAPPEIADWLDAAREEAPSAHVLEAAVALAVTGASAAGVASGAALHTAKGLGTAAKAGSLALVKWGVAGVIAGSAVAGGSAWVHHATPPREQQSVATPAEKAARMPRSPAATSPVATPTVSASAPSPESPTLAPEPPLMARSAGTASSAAQPDARMSAELMLLERAQASADSGKRALALDLLAEHARRFGPNSTLSPEARYLKLEVLARSGRQAEARAVAREILAHDANGPHAGRARHVLEEQE